MQGSSERKGAGSSATQINTGGELTFCGETLTAVDVSCAAGVAAGAGVTTAAAWVGATTPLLHTMGARAPPL
jgi:hypothetical protein